MCRCVADHNNAHSALFKTLCKLSKGCEWPLFCGPYRSRCKHHKWGVTCRNVCGRLLLVIFRRDPEWQQCRYIDGLARHCCEQRKVSLGIVQCCWIRNLDVSDPLRPRISIRHHALSSHVAHEHHCAEALVWDKHGCIGCMQITRKRFPRARCAMSRTLVEHNNIVNVCASIDNTGCSGRCHNGDVCIRIGTLDRATQRQRQYHITEEGRLDNDPLHARHRRCCHDHSSGLRRSCSSSTAT